MKFAVIETGGKQYKVSEGSVLSVEKIVGKTAGDTVLFDKVLLVSDGGETRIGAPYIAGAQVEVSLVAEGRAKKVTVIKYKAKSRYFKKRGHRQPYAKVSVKKIV